MMDLITQYQTVAQSFPEELTRLELRPGAIKPIITREIDSASELMSLIQTYDGHGWLECTDAVRYRANEDWIAPAGNAEGGLSGTTRVLAGEIVGGRVLDNAPLQSLQIRHLYGERWTVTEIEEANEGLEMIFFDTAYASVLRCSEIAALSYRTCWDPSAARSVAVRFTGFVEE